MHLSGYGVYDYGAYVTAIAQSLMKIYMNGLPVGGNFVKKRREGRKTLPATL